MQDPFLKKSYRGGRTCFLRPSFCPVPLGSLTFILDGEMLFLASSGCSSCDGKAKTKTGRHNLQLYLSFSVCLPAKQASLFICPLKIHSQAKPSAKSPGRRSIRAALHKTASSINEGVMMATQFPGRNANGGRIIGRNAQHFLMPPISAYLHSISSCRQ